MRLFNSLCQRKQNKNSFFIETVALTPVTLYCDPVVYVTVTSTSIRGETGLIASHSVCCRNRPRREEVHQGKRSQEKTQLASVLFSSCDMEVKLRLTDPRFGQ